MNAIIVTGGKQYKVAEGDVVYIESGETIPADGELVEAVSLKINESTLTGEPEVDKTVNEADFDPEATYPSNAVLRGTTVADGYGVMVVTAVGDATEAGRVTEQSTVQSEEQTPLDRQLTRLSRLIGRLGILLSALIFCVMLGKAIFAGGLLALFVVFVIMYMVGIDQWVCIGFGVVSASVLVWATFRMNAKYGEWGLMKFHALRSHPRYIISRRKFLRLFSPTIKNRKA